MEHKPQDDKLSMKENLHIILKAFKVSLLLKKPMCIIINILGCAIALLPLAIANTLSRLTNSTEQLYGSGVKNAWPTILLFLVLVGFYTLQIVYSFLANYFGTKENLQINEYIKETVIRTSCKVKYKYIQNSDDYREKISFIENESGQRVANSFQMIIQFIQCIIQCISIFQALWIFQPWIVVCLLVTSIPAIILANKQKDSEYRFKTKWMMEGALVIHYYGMCCAPDSMNDLRHWRILGIIKAGWKNIAGQYIIKKNKMTQRHLVYNSLADFLRSSVYIIILLITAQEILKNPLIGLGSYMFINSLVGDFQNTINSLFVNIANFFGNIKYMKDYFDLTTFEDEQFSHAEKIECPSIVFNHVHFTYPGTNTEVLKDINVQIKPGEKVAIVGENGSGKSTFINLICGLYEADEGVIKVSGKEINTNLSSIRKSISVVFQDFCHYEATLRENITVSDIHKEIDESLLNDICKKTGVDIIIRNEKNGLDEMIGIFNEDGNNLSGGQWQKIVLARALYRNQASMMIMDEPTAALDAVSESQIYSNFSELTKGKTTLLVSHRLGICNVVDRILVFKDGQIIEDGDHTSLMEKDGYYKKLYTAQAIWYQ